MEGLSGLIFRHSVITQQAGSAITPYTSTDESNFLRGAGVTFGSKEMECSLFASYNGSMLDSGGQLLHFDNYRRTAHYGFRTGHTQQYA